MSTVQNELTSASVSGVAQAAAAQRRTTTASLRTKSTKPEAETTESPWICCSVDGDRGFCYCTQVMAIDGRPLECGMDPAEFAMVWHEIHATGWARRWGLRHPVRDEVHRAMQVLVRNVLPKPQCEYEIVSTELKFT